MVPADGTVRSLVLADHGLHPASAVAEVDSFIHIGRHLKNKGLPVPAIYFADAFAGLVFLEDLGDACLQAAALGEPDRRRMLAVYRHVVDALIALAIDGVEGFDPDWTYQSRAYDREVILERECRYFCEAFLKRYAGLEFGFDDFADEFNRLADSALSDGLEGFLHRDMQSRNIMLKDGNCYFIDFQGGRLGPVQYDLASLLIDPYVGLAPEEQAHLLDYALNRMACRRPLDAARFRRGFAPAHSAATYRFSARSVFFPSSRARPSSSVTFPPRCRVSRSGWQLGRRFSEIAANRRSSSRETGIALSFILFRKFEFRICFGFRYSIFGFQLIV